MLRLGELLKAGGGDAKAGKVAFGNTCAKCHKLFGEGGNVGPDLTGYERGNQLYWMIGPPTEDSPLTPTYYAMSLLFHTTAPGWQIIGVQPLYVISLANAERLVSCRRNPLVLLSNDRNIL